MSTITAIAKSSTKNHGQLKKAIISSKNFSHFEFPEKEMQAFKLRFEAQKKKEAYKHSLIVGSILIGMIMVLYRMWS
ncbi:hypothetical protein [Aquimarina rhabdastrellae]